MIGFIQGEVLFSDASELIINTQSGVGYQIYFSELLTEGTLAGVFISQVVKETSEELYGFKSLRDKKMFETLTSVKGVGPKSAFALMASIPSNQIINAIIHDDKKTLTKAPGIGAKAASQIILDLSNKIEKVRMFSNKSVASNAKAQTAVISEPGQQVLFEVEAEIDEVPVYADNVILQDTLMACKELGFSEEKITPIASKILEQNQINKAEQLVHLVLKEV